MRAQRRDDRLKALSWPLLQEVDQVSLGPRDTLIMAAGFEQRAIAVLQRIVGSASRGFSVRCACYLPTLESNDHQRADVSSLCAQVNATLQFVLYDRENPAGAAAQFLHDVPSDGALYVDVSGMSRLLIVQLLTEIIRKGHGCRTKIFYTEALEYPPSLEEFTKRTADESADPFSIAMFLSSGVFRLTIVPELSTVAMQGQPIHTILFPSWNPSQMEAIFAEIQASYFTLIHGAPPDPKNKWRLDAIRSINRMPSSVRCFNSETSTLDYRETLSVLLDIYAKHAQREKLLIVPTGSKMQAVAVAVAMGWLSDLQIAYPTPRSFAAPTNYTRGIKTVHSMSLTELSPS